MINSNSRLKVELEQNGEDLTVHLDGFVDEDAVFSKDKPAEVKKIIIDFEKVKMINSCGLRTWVAWVKALEGSVQITFRNCHRNIVDPINILEGFMPSGTMLESLYVPYVCESCDHEEEVLCKRGVDFKEGSADTAEMNNIPDQHKCPKCGSEMDIDILPTKFFKFLKYRS